MAIYRLKYKCSAGAGLLYARNKQDIQSVVEEFSKPDYILPKPLSLPECPNLPGLVERIDGDTLSFDYDGLFNPSKEPFSCDVSEDFRIEVRQESLPTFQRSQPYFLEHKVGNLYVLPYTQINSVFLPEGLAEKISQVDATAVAIAAERYLRSLVPKLGSLHMFSVEIAPGTGGHKN